MAYDPKAIPLGITLRFKAIGAAILNASPFLPLSVKLRQKIITGSTSVE